MFDQQIQPIANILNLHAVVDEGKPHFNVYVQSTLSQFVYQASLVCALEKPGPNAVCTFIAESIMVPVI
jgi:hypothetical protein